jgi:hypothetical protein
MSTEQEQKTSNNATVTVAGHEVNLLRQTSGRINVNVKNETLAKLIYLAAHEEFSDRVHEPTNFGYNPNWNLEIEAGKPNAQAEVSVGTVAAIVEGLQEQYPDNAEIIRQKPRVDQKYSAVFLKHKEQREARETVAHMAGVAEHFLKDRGTSISLDQRNELVERMAKAYLHDRPILEEIRATRNPVVEAHNAVDHLAGVVQHFVADTMPDKPMSVDETRQLAENMAQAYSRDKAIHKGGKSVGWSVV